MILLVHSETTALTVAARLGRAEYSYYFVLRSFMPLLEKIGLVIPIADPARDADRIFHKAREQGQECLLISFSPPHRTAVNLDCPTIVVFAWEFDTLPNESWSSDRRDDWIWALHRIGRAIVHSENTAEIVRAALGQDFPVISIPSPLWDKFSRFAHVPRGGIAGRSTELAVRGTALDSQSLDFAIMRHDLNWFDFVVAARKLHANRTLSLSGTIYTSVFNPEDGRKNWTDMVACFCRTFAHEPGATLVLKLTHHDGTLGMAMLVQLLWRLAPFECRVILIDGFLDDAAYAALVDATSYVVNTAHGEGQCLPLMEFMSAGKPAIAPPHTGMADYLSADCCFLIDSSAEPTFWPQDTRRALRTTRRRIDAASVDRAYRESFDTIRDNPERYEEMSQAATNALRRHCSVEIAESRLRRMVDDALASAPLRERIQEPT